MQINGGNWTGERGKRACSPYRNLENPLGVSSGGRNLASFLHLPRLLDYL